MIIEEKCCKCKKYPVANKKYKLCVFCNKNRLDSLNEKSKKEKLLRKQKEKNEIISKMGYTVLRSNLLNDRICSFLGCISKLYTFKYNGVCKYHFHVIKSKEKKQKIKVTSKEQKTKIKLSILKKQEKEKHIEETNNICEGCSKSFSFLDYSHILSVKQRKDLELDKDNKNLLCRKCHEKWESWDPNQQFQLKCIDYNLNFLRKNDEKSFWRIYFKCIDNQMFKEAKKIEEIDNDFKLNNNE